MRRTEAFLVPFLVLVLGGEAPAACAEVVTYELAAPPLRLFQSCSAGFWVWGLGLIPILESPPTNPKPSQIKQQLSPPPPRCLLVLCWVGEGGPLLGEAITVGYRKLQVWLYGLGYWKFGVWAQGSGRISVSRFRILVQGLGQGFGFTV